MGLEYLCGALKKKIVIVGPAQPYRGGQSLVEAHMYDTLTRMGYEVETVSFNLLYPKIFFPGTSQYDNSETIFFPHQDKIHRLINSINPLTWVKASNKILALKPDLVIFVWWMPFFGPAYSYIAKRIKRKSKASISFLVENYISHENRWFDKWMSKRTLDLADTFICQSNYVKNAIAENHLNKPIHKTTLSVFECFDLKRYNKTQAREMLGITAEKVILFFGLIRRYKGLDKLIQAMKFFADTHPDYHLLIVGEAYEDPKYYTDLITEVGIEDRSTFTNKFIENQNIEPYFRSSDVVCLPYNSATQSGILMMAYGFSVPAIVTDVGGLAELIAEGKTGYIVEDNTPKGIAETLVRFYDNDQEDFAANIKNLNQSLGYKNMTEIIPGCIAKK